ncbi:MAG: nucleotide exchange factor GrpE [candidate division Zixibacteria bacterium]|nr:nucleotide exchange factor GrpE [candidate division Zixibacteria bacterium]
MSEDKEIKAEELKKDAAEDTATPAPAPAEEPVLTEEEKLRGRVAELEDKLLRSMAELDNYRKRTARQFEDIARTANDKLLGELFDVVTNLDRALEHCRDGADIESLRQGMELIQSQFIGLLARNDIQPIVALGQPFDPKYHEALAHIDSNEYAANLVCVEITKGYMQGDRVIRHTQVAVSRGPVADSKEGK